MVEVVILGVDGSAGDGDAAALVERAVLDAQLLGHGGGQELGVVAAEGVTRVFLRQFIQGGVEEYASVDAALLQDLVGVGAAVQASLADVGPVRCILGFRHDTIIGFLDPPLAGLRFILDLWLPSAGSSGQGF